MNILRRFIKAAIFGIGGILVLTLVWLNSQAQTPIRKSKPAAKILVGEQAMATETRVQQQPVRPPQPLSLEEKRRHFRSVINSLAEQSKLYPGQNLGQVFSPNIWKPNFNLLPSPPTLTTRQTWIDKVGWLDFSYPVFIGKQSDGGKEHYLAWWESRDRAFLNVHLNAVEGTYLLDFSVNSPSNFLEVFESSLSNVGMQIGVAQGHLLVPLFAAKAGWYDITIPAKGGSVWTFFSVEIDHVK